ncbi:hypothetical protein QVD17_14854 [Tagetes erecta]|uniref:F-box domain-containing protein n=1 Tax=Tagetes erecta TaxID=13708 RepID=A0AAD8KN72_TARER|nr:hypothetical protein QVD17_14854 [Tagetes erecta]
MSDNIPLEIQIEIMKRLPVKSLIQFRSVSKPWKSIIDTPNFIAAHLHHTQQHRLLVYCDEPVGDDPNYYVLFADNDTFPQHKLSLTIPLLVNEFIDYPNISIIGSSRGLFCFHGDVPNNPRDASVQPMAIIWNPCVKRVIPVLVPDVTTKFFICFLGFGVCPTTNDPKIIKIRFIRDVSETITSHIPRQVEVFTLSTRAWRSSYGNLPPKSIYLRGSALDVDGFLYWLANDIIAMTNVIISFDLTSEEFRQVNLPDSLTRCRHINLSISKLRGSLVLSHVIEEGDNCVISVWLMVGGVAKSFSKLYSVNVRATYEAWLRGFRKNGEPIIEVLEEDDLPFFKLGVYDPYSKRISCFLTSGMMSATFEVYPYMETLLLLDQTNVAVYNETNSINFLDDLVV